MATSCISEIKSVFFAKSAKYIALETGNAYTDNEIAHLDKKFEDVSDNIMWVINDTSKHTMSTIDKLDHEIKNGQIKVKEVSGMRKDRYSSIAYNYWCMCQLELQLKPKKQNIMNYNDIFKVRAPKKVSRF